ncbi:glutamate--cysteine ligase regulatory subunit [Erpetoichthys calabaricus]|uniref:Glutamate--cysteine ligase regulatory subunit n=1 Tax=Erpetoichthys calabaricus TaxID=27687 RepID=A0A8C4S5I6_ERPCA|nr:glutamate--cysteine ligase regulatory subunit [Erpetoichthys calabaricus]
METTNPAAQRLFSQATVLNMHTGNLVNWNRQKKKCPSSPGEELQDCIRATLNEWSSKIGPDQGLALANATLECSMPQAAEVITPEEREELKVSVKLFLTGSDASSIRSAVELACATLGVSQLDSVIIVPPPLDDGIGITLDHLKPFWEVLELLVQSQKIAAIGTSDLDKTLLEQLHTWAQVKPSSNQVNLASCCVMPPDLTAFAKEYDIQLLTHNDPKELMSVTSFQETISDVTKDPQATEWLLGWVLRYSIIVKSRGIIRSKGYLVQAKRSNC